MINSTIKKTKFRKNKSRKFIKGGQKNFTEKIGEIMHDLEDIKIVDISEERKKEEVVKGIGLLIRSWHPFSMKYKRRIKENPFDIDQKVIQTKDEETKQKWLEAKDDISVINKKYKSRLSNKKKHKLKREDIKKIEKFLREKFKKIGYILVRMTLEGKPYGYTIRKKTDHGVVSLLDILTMQRLLLEFLYTKYEKKIEFIKSHESDGSWAEIQDKIKQKLKEYEEEQKNADDVVSSSSESSIVRSMHPSLIKSSGRRISPLYPPACDEIAASHPARELVGCQKAPCSIDSIRPPSTHGGTIFWVRHCESCANVVNLQKKMMLNDRGIFIPALCTQEGILQSLRTGMILSDILKNKGFTSVSIFSSHLARAVQTAALIRKSLEEYNSVEENKLTIGGENFRIPFVKEKVNHGEKLLNPFRKLLHGKEQSSVNSMSFEDSQRYCDMIHQMVGFAECQKKYLVDSTEGGTKMSYKELNEYKCSHEKFRKLVLPKIHLEENSNHAIIIVSHGGYISDMINDFWKLKGLERKMKTSKYPNDINNRDNLSIHMERYDANYQVIEYSPNMQLELNNDGIPHILKGVISRESFQSKTYLEPTNKPDKSKKEDIKKAYEAKRNENIIAIAEKFDLYVNEKMRETNNDKVRLLTCKYKDAEIS